MTSRGNNLLSDSKEQLTAGTLLRGVIYARYSDGANQTDQSLEGQVRECRKYAQDNGIAVIREYLDPHISGKDAEKRPAFQEMIRDSDKHSFDVVIVWKTDRFARNRYDSARYKERLRRNGISIRYAAEHIPDSAEGIILESMLEGMAEYYSAELKQKIQRGMRESAYKHRVLTRPPMGYKTGPNREYVIDEETAPLIRLVFQLYNSGEKLKDIADHVNAFGIRTGLNHPLEARTISAIVANEKYIGVYEYKNGEIRAENAIPPIVDKDTFYEAQRRREAQKRRKYTRRNLGRSSLNDYLLSTLVFCGDCGCTMYGETITKKNKKKASKQYGYYSCLHHRQHPQTSTCSVCSVPQKALEWLVKDVIKSIVLNDELRNLIRRHVTEVASSNEYEERIKSIKRNKSSKEQSIRNLIDTLERGNYSDAIITRLKALESEVHLLELELKKVTQMSGKISDQISWGLSCIQKETVLSNAEWKKIVATFVKSVTCYSDGTVHVCLNFYNNPSPNSNHFGIKVSKSLSSYLSQKRKENVQKCRGSLHQTTANPEPASPVGSGFVRFRHIWLF